MSDDVLTPEAPRASEAYPDTRFSKRRLSPIEASAYLEAAHGITLARATLDKYRCVGGGPRFQRFGARVLYQREELDSWALQRLGALLSNTSCKEVTR